MCGVEIELLDSDHVFADGKVPASRIRVRSRAVGDGYFPEPDEAKLGHSTFVPDDLLEKTRNGYRVVGRVSDLINVAGKKVHPAQVEAEILRCKGVREAIVFARNSERRNEEIVACVVATDAVSEDELLAHCRAHLSSWQTPRRILRIDRIPVNERGKISRRELAQRYAAGTILNDPHFVSLDVGNGFKRLGRSRGGNQSDRASRRSDRLGRNAFRFRN